MLVPTRVYIAQDKHDEAVRASASADSQAPLVSWLVRIMDCKYRIQKLAQEPQSPLGFRDLTSSPQTRARASCGIRTHDLPLTERVLCQLS